MPPNPKTVSATLAVKDTRPKAVTPEPQKDEEWIFKVRGRGTSGWMSYLKQGDQWIPLRSSDTSFLSAITAIEPEVLRLAFPHTKGQVKP